MKNTTTYVVLLFALTLRSAPVGAEHENDCREHAYENHNQVDYKPLKLARVRGTGVIEIRENVIKPNETVPGACLSLFTPEEKFIKNTKADLSGAFQFDDVAPGRYRLLVRAPGFCTANIPILVVKASRKSKVLRRKIVVHYRVSGIDTCSWGAIGEESAIRNR
jgi:hypothetical protein